MALMKECPTCRKRNSEKAKYCTNCKKSLAKLSGLVWWISYYDVDKKLTRKRIGESRAAAEQELRKQLTARAEGRHIQKSVDAKTKFKDLAKWYLDLIKDQKNYKRSAMTIKNHLIPYFGDKLLSNINPGDVDGFKKKRLAAPSGRTPKKSLVAPASVNREIACIKHLFNVAIKAGRAEKNPCYGVKMEKECNVRDRVLSEEEFIRLLAHSPDHLRPLLKMAYFTGMRRGELLSLTWGAIDLKEGFVHLKAENTKTKEPRDVPLHPELIAMLQAMPRGLPKTPVFTYPRWPLQNPPLAAGSKSPGRQ